MITITSTSEIYFFLEGDTWYRFRDGKFVYDVCWLNDRRWILPHN